jgi:transcriptional regulator
MKCFHSKNELKVSDRHYVNSPKHDNCILCLVDDRGAMSQKEISEALNISKAEVLQIEIQALKKIQRLHQKLNVFT